MKKIRDGLYPVTHRTAGTSGAVSRRCGVPGVPLRPPSFPLAKTPASHLPLCRDLPPVPLPTPEPKRVEDLDCNIRPGGLVPPPSTSQWVDSGTVPILIASDTTTVSLANGDPMDMLNHMRTESSSPVVLGGASASVAGEGKAVSPPPVTVAEDEGGSSVAIYIPSGETSSCPNVSWGASLKKPPRPSLTM